MTPRRVVEINTLVEFTLMSVVKCLLILRLSTSYWELGMIVRALHYM